MSTGPVVQFPVPVPAKARPGDGSASLDVAALVDRSPVEITAHLLRGRWTALVVWRLFWGDKRFYQLLREAEGITRRALAHELEQLERLGIVERRVRHLGPSKVQYGLTALGESLKLVVGAMYEWGLLARHRLPARGPSVATFEADAP